GRPTMPSAPGVRAGKAPSSNRIGCGRGPAIAIADRCGWRQSGAPPLPSSLPMAPPITTGASTRGAASGSGTRSGCSTACSVQEHAVEHPDLVPLPDAAPRVDAPVVIGGAIGKLDGSGGAPDCRQPHRSAMAIAGPRPQPIRLLEGAFPARTPGAEGIVGRP